MLPPPLDDAPRRGHRKLHKRLRECSHVPTVQLPDVLRQTSDAGDEDITRPQGANVAMFANMNQSIVGMLAAAGSTVDFNERFEGNSSDEDDDDSQRQQRFPRPTGIAQTTVISRQRVSKHRRKFSGNMIKSLAALPRLATRKSSKSASQPEHVEEPAQDLVSPSIEVTEADEYRIAPVMSRMIEAQDEMSSRPSFDIVRKSGEGLAEEAPSKLAKKLKDIFKFDQYEDVIAEYPCWLLQNVLLQGYMYITQRHICFYSYLPKKSNEVAKTGFLAKTGKRNPKYTRYWFRLKGDVLAYYKDAANPYFPHNQIDLRFAISASITDKDKEGLHFTVETHHRTYYLKADSPQSAKEWVKSLQRVIFRSHNDGDSVKISLPILNVVDIENSPMLEFAETCKIRVYDNDETFAIDEYFFSFFHPGSDAFNVLKILIEGVQDGSDRLGIPGDSSGPSSQTPSDRGKLESVRATLHSPVASSRGSGELARASIDIPIRRSFEDRPRKATQESSESYVDPSISNLVSSSEGPSASQILKGSEVFHSPTIRRSGSIRRSESVRRSGSIRRDKDRIPGIQHIRSDPVILHKAPSPTIIGRAGRFASYLTNNTRRMSSLLATESMGYVEKVSGMWKGQHKHYNAPAALKTDEELNQDDEEQVALSNKRFREHFALPESEKLVATYFASLFRVLPLYGKVYISNRSFCFRSLLPGVRTQLVLPLKDVETAAKEKGFRLGFHGMVLVIRGHEELFFELSDVGARDDCVVTMLQTLETARFLSGEAWHDEEQEMVETALAERDSLHEAAKEHFPGHEEFPKTRTGGAEPTILFDDPRASFLNFKPKQPLKITCLTIGSRGDVQPYIAFCKGLLNEGHHPTIATHAEFQDWVESHGIGFKAIAGDPSELMRIVIENGTFTLAFFREANTKFRSWLDELLITAWDACQGADVLIESPSAMAGIHIAEKLQIPYFRAFTMPWTRTRAYPHAFVMPETKKGGAFNYMTYVMFDNVFWKAIAGQVNRWRHTYLELPSTNLDRLMPNKVPFLYNFSPTVVPPPLDFSDWIRVTGYWFLDEGGDWTPPEDLAEFIKKARDDGKRLVYVGFGSIIVSDPAKMTQDVVDAVLKADVRCILSKGWSDRLPGKTLPPGDAPKQDTVVLPPEVFQIKSAPHDWLFRQIDAAAHHGGSGTTGASLRAGIPTIIRPFFGDQFFFGARVEDLGVGIQLKKWGAVSFARALWEATNSQRMIDRARVLGERIREENGVDNAIQIMYRDLEYSKSLIRSKAGKNAKPVDDDEVEEESWTFVRPDGGVEEVAEQDMEKSVILGTAADDPNVASLALGSKVLAQTATA